MITMDEATRKEVTAIRDMVDRVAKDIACRSDMLEVYRQFGAINQDNAEGIVQGINMILFQAVPKEGPQG